MSKERRRPRPKATLRTRNGISTSKEKPKEKPMIAALEKRAEGITGVHVQERGHYCGGQPCYMISSTMDSEARYTSYRTLLERLQADGYEAVVRNGEIYPIKQVIPDWWEKVRSSSL